MKKIFIVYGHYNDKSFNASIRDTFVETVNNNGHSTDVVDLYKEKFDPVFSGEEPNEDVLKHRKTEIDFISGAVSRIGKKHGIKTPLNDLMYNIIKIKEGMYI